jgi:predicted acetyltransferase
LACAARDECAASPCEVRLRRLEITTDRRNVASWKVIEVNGGAFVEEFVQPQYDDDVRLRFRVNL